MAYDTPYVGMAPTKNNGHIKSGEPCISNITWPLYFSIFVMQLSTHYSFIYRLVNLSDELQETVPTTGFS